MINLLKFIWCLPYTCIIWIFYIIPITLISKDIKFIDWKTSDHGHSVPVFKLVSQSSWYAKKWKDWLGWAGPYVVIIRYTSDISPIDIIRTTRHELKHVDQQANWGLLFYPVYLAHSIFIWFFRPKLHAYLDNPFEKEARAAAGQLVNIPRHMWSNQKDRWPWW